MAPVVLQGLRQDLLFVVILRKGAGDAGNPHRMGSWLGGLMVPRDSIARMVIINIVFFQEPPQVVTGPFWGGRGRGARATGKYGQSATHACKWGTCWSNARARRKKSPGLGAQTRGRG